jgi:hypothetical protein
LILPEYQQVGQWQNFALAPTTPSLTKTHRLAQALRDGGEGLAGSSNPARAAVRAPNAWTPRRAKLRPHLLTNGTPLGGPTVLLSGPFASQCFKPPAQTRLYPMPTREHLLEGEVEPPRIGLACGILQEK